MLGSLGDTHSLFADTHGSFVDTHGSLRKHTDLFCKIIEYRLRDYREKRLRLKKIQPIEN